MKKLILFLLFLGSIFQVKAQERYNSSNGRNGTSKYAQQNKQKGFDPNKLVFGGTVGLMFGSVTNIAVIPAIGYRITDKFAAGVTIGYQYYRDNRPGFTVPAINLISGAIKSEPLKQSIYTGGLWARYIVIPNIILNAEFEANSINFYDSDKPRVVDADGWQRLAKSRLTIPSLLLGGGFRQPIGDMGSMYIMAMYDVLQNIPSNTREHPITGEKQSISQYAGSIFLRVGYAIGF